MAIVRRTPSQPSRVSGWDPLEMVRDMLQWDPWREMTRIAPEEPGTFIPSFEVKETNDAFIFKADLPGVKEEDVEISITGNRLTVSGQRESEKREESETYYALERSYGTFSRSFTLPREADTEHVDAELKNGVLTLRIPKRTEAQAKKIELRKGDKGAKA